MMNIDFDPATKNINLTFSNPLSADISLEWSDTQSYFKTIDTPIDLFAYKESIYNPCTFSYHEGRYNISGSGCAYTAESVRLAQAEISAHSSRSLYQVSSFPIYYFDLDQLATDRGFKDVLVQPLSAGGWTPTQNFANLFTDQLGLSALRVPSSKGSECCMVFYADDRLPDGFFTRISDPASPPAILP